MKYISVRNIKKMLKRSTIGTPLMFFMIGIIIAIIIRASLEFYFIIIPLFSILSLLLYWAGWSTERELPVKVRIDDKGMYSWKRNKKEELIPWDTVDEFREMYDIKSNDYLIYYKKKKGYNISLIRRGYSEFALDNNAAKIAMAKFDEYKNKNKEITDYDSFTRKKIHGKWFKHY